MAHCPICQTEQNRWKVILSSQFSGFACPTCKTELTPDRVFSGVLGGGGALIYIALFTIFPLWFSIPTAILILIGFVLFHDKYMPLHTKAPSP